jgi:signal transduction histidine kinase
VTGPDAESTRTLRHETRTALTAVIWLSEALQKPDLPEGQRARFAAMLGTEAKKLQGLVAEMLPPGGRDAPTGQEAVDGPEA